MKKLFVGIAATAMAAALCVSFAACGEPSSAKDVQGYEVTEEQWDAAFDTFDKEDAKFTIEETTTYEMTYTADLTIVGGKKTSGTYTNKSTLTYVNNGVKQSVKGESNAASTGDYTYDELVQYLGMSTYAPKEGKTEIEMYLDRTDGKHILYRKDVNGDWQKGETFGGDLFDDGQLGEQGDFDQYKYDETLKGYVDKDYTEKSKDYVVYKFNKDAQLIAVYMYSTTGTGNALGSTTERSYVISHKAGDITLPTVD